jgi:diguanylate cyclase (GGDEF)-like protein
MIKVLQWIEDISSSRDRDRVAAIVVRAVFDLLQARLTMLFRVIHTPDGPRILPLVRSTVHGLEAVSPRDVVEFDESGSRLSHDEGAPLHNFPLLARAFTSGLLGIEPRKKGVALIWPVKSTSTSSVSAIVVAELDHLPDVEETELVTRFLTFFGNYVGLLDYSELDSLTGLNNRKTYDETFERLLAQIPAAIKPAEGADRRKDDNVVNPYWLGEIDIDHFKRINDSFGHLFGDEVLLRLANLMRSCFRASDALYRFGGEEFVVMLRSSSKENAANTFERFRRAVESHEFPQVGQVTCSVGYTRVDPLLLPADILGQADAALYFSKENGRNKACCYDDLVDSGLLLPKSVLTPQLDPDIDALFD